MQTAYYITTYGTLDSLKEHAGRLVFMTLDPLEEALPLTPDRKVVVALHSSAYNDLWTSHPDVNTLADPLRNSAITDAQAIALQSNDVQKGQTVFDVIDKLSQRCSGFKFQIK